MRGINKATILGVLGRDPEVKYASNGNAVCTLSVATNEEWKDKQTGEKKEAVEWHSVKIFGRLAEVAGEYLTKGARVYLEGKIKTESWEKDGEKKYKTVIIADEMIMLGEPGAQRASRPAIGDREGVEKMRSQGVASSNQRGGLSGQAKTPPPADDFEDDVPF